MKSCRGGLLIGWVIWLVFCVTPLAYAQAPKIIGGPPPGSSNAMGGMIELLKMKGVISADEAASLMESSGGGMASGKETSAVIELLQRKGIITPEEAAQFSARHIGAGTDQESGTVLAPSAREDEYVRKISKKVAREIRQDVQDRVKAEMQEEKAKDVKGVMASAPDWAQRIRFGGDIRLRYQSDIFDKDNATLLKVGSNGTVSGDLLNTTQDRNRFRIRARLGATAKLDETLEAGMRITTGNETDPVSTNDTLGDYFNKDGIVMDLVYLKWKPVQEVTIYGGRHPNPWFYTDLIWDNDINFEGVAGTYTHQFTDEVSAFVTGGAFPLQELEFTERDKWLFAGQVGAEIKPDPDLTAKIGVAYYDFVNTVGQANTIQRPDENDHTAPLFVQKGNTLFNIEPTGIRVALASEFRELNVTGQVDVGFWKPIHVILVGDYVRNMAFDKNDVQRRTGLQSVPEEVEGYQVGLQVGHPKARRFGEWTAYLYYKYLEADAVVDAFTDSDFHGGGTNAQGWILGAEMGLYKNVWLTAKWLTSDEISGPPLSIDTFQVDLNAGF